MFYAYVFSLFCVTLCDSCSSFVQKVGELEILVARDVIKYVKEVQGWAEDLLPKVIKHDHMEATSKISEVVRILCFQIVTIPNSILLCFIKIQYFMRYNSLYKGNIFPRE